MGKKKIAIVWLWYVWLPLACAIAWTDKYEVIGFDIDEDKVKNVNKKINYLQDEYVGEKLRNVEIFATTRIEDLNNTDIYFVCVPTPVDWTKPDLSPLSSASRLVGKTLKENALVIFESTVNPGITRDYVIPILEEESNLKCGEKFYLAYCPELIDPGNPTWNVSNIPRIVGWLNEKSTKIAAEIYRSFLNAEIREVSSIEVAEAAKVFTNIYRDINIALVNEFAQFIDIYNKNHSVNMDIKEIIDASTVKPFWFMPHYPGIGVWGHCIPVDPYYVIEKGASMLIDLGLIKKARQVNNAMPSYVIGLIKEKLKEYGKSMEDQRIGILGLSYKKNIPDLRNSPAVDFIKLLSAENPKKISSYDPYHLEISDEETALDLINSSDIIILATDHDDFASIEEKCFSDLLLLIDGKNLYDRRKMEEKGIRYIGIGR